MPRANGIIQDKGITIAKEPMTSNTIWDWFVETILFSSAVLEEVALLKRILRCFELVLGLKINLAKSTLVGVGCPLEVGQPLASKLHCKVGNLPMIYLDCKWELEKDPKLFGILWLSILSGSWLYEKGIIVLWEEELHWLRPLCLIFQFTLSHCIFYFFLVEYFVSFFLMPVAVRESWIVSGGTFVGRW